MSKSMTKEWMVYFAIWLLLLLAPIISMLLRMEGDATLTFSWREVFRSWTILLPYLIVFLIHNFIIAPLLIYRKKAIAYWVLTLCILVIFTMFQCSHRPTGQPMLPDISRHDCPPAAIDGHPFVAGDSVRHRPGMAPPPRGFDHRPAPMRHEPNQEVRPQEWPPHDDRFHEGPPLLMGQRDIVSLIILILMIGMNLGVKLYFKSSKDAEAMRLLEKKSLEQQLEYLKYQINPHFFMNTLNNIHALIDIEPEEAKSSIVELSRMMRYVLHDGARSQVLLSKDIEFLRHYIALMRLRYTDKVTIRFDVPEEITDRMVPPMLLITFVENAFKHGVSYKHPSFIDVHISTTDERLCFTCRNSRIEEKQESHGGVGLSNTRQRLDLIYGNTYQWETKDEPDVYEVYLEIPFLQPESHGQPKQAK